MEGGGGGGGGGSGCGLAGGRGGDLAEHAWRLAAVPLTRQLNWRGGCGGGRRADGAPACLNASEKIIICAV